MQKKPAYVARYINSQGQRIPLLKGDWDSPPKRVPSGIERLNGFSSEGFVASHTDFLARFPRLRKLHLSIGQPIDLAGLYQLPELWELIINTNWISPKCIVLDLARLPGLRRLTTPYSAKIRGWERLRNLMELRVDHIYGLKRLDLSHHPRLKTLALGPANGIEEVCLSGLASLRSLTLACMARLKSILGTEFYDTVTSLDIRGSHKIPQSLLRRFSKLESVVIGMKSSITPDNFPLCKPHILPLPV